MEILGKMTCYNEYLLLKSGGFTLVKPPFVCYNDIDKYYLIVCPVVCFLYLSFCGNCRR